MTSTRVEGRKHHQALKVMGFPERVALFVAAIHRPRAEELLSGFSKGPQERASTRERLQHGDPQDRSRRRERWQNMSPEERAKRRGPQTPPGTQGEPAGDSRPPAAQ